MTTEAKRFSAAELWLIGQGCERHGVSEVGTWRLGPVSADVAGVENRVMLGDFLRPASAVSVTLGENRSKVYVLHDTRTVPGKITWSEIEKAGATVNPGLVMGLVMSTGQQVSTIPVRWEYGAPWTITSKTCG